MLLDFIAGFMGAKIGKKDIITPRKIPSYNFDSIASNIDNMSAEYVPIAKAQINVETDGNQNSNKIDQDITPNFVGYGANFNNYASSDLYNANGVIVDNPVASKKVAKNMIYQGYDVFMGE